MGQFLEDRWDDHDAVIEGWKQLNLAEQDEVIQRSGIGDYDSCGRAILRQLSVVLRHAGGG